MEIKNKKQILTTLISVLVSVFLVATAVYAVTTIGEDVSVGRDLFVTNGEISTLSLQAISGIYINAGNQIIWCEDETCETYYIGFDSVSENLLSIVPGVGWQANLYIGNITEDRTFTFPDASGTFALMGLPATGQTLCWDEGGNVIDCEGTGQDGELQKGIKLIDNEDGTVTDPGTGLMWEKKTDDDGIHDKDNTYTWLEALEFCTTEVNAEEFAGYNDWRLPNINELKSFWEITWGHSPNTVSNYYWSSTAYQDLPSLAWSVGFGEGDVYNGDKAGSSYVRCVRGQ